MACPQFSRIRKVYSPTEALAGELQEPAQFGHRARKCPFQRFSGSAPRLHSTRFPRTILLDLFIVILIF